MAVKCPVTGKECPYLQKLETDVCPREHDCDAVKNSYSEIIKKPPASKKTVALIIAAILILLASILAVYLFVFSNGFPFGWNSQGKNNPGNPSANQPETSTASPTQADGAAVETTSPPTSIPIPSKTALPPVPVTGEAALKPVRIESDDILAEIREVPLDQDGKIEVISSAEIVSWYEGSYLPGETGNCIIFGFRHFGGLAGALYPLDKLRTGDIIIFTLDNGLKVVQQVYDSIIYRDGFLPAEVFALDGDEPRTVIISETGNIDPTTGRYLDFIVVFAH
ncbi:MAG: class F sortase [Clostridia bacterium]|nr:class F sortase [Clostridia bacterium]